MHPLDLEFFEAYKHLDKLCSEMYARQGGLSEYIMEMEDRAYIGRHRVSGWENDYQMLKRARWLRSCLAHECREEQVCVESDLTFIKEFYSRVFSLQDPLAMLRSALTPGSKPDVIEVYMQPEELRVTQPPEPVEQKSEPADHAPTESVEKKGGSDKKMLAIFCGILGFLFVASVVVFLILML